ncbi:polyribonucleotide nucleotidyltransferase [Tuwongella immobilis]|uniref:Polyribonucleotide nucleotidyltransferase n=1 Tax=Tuwongella immobilis TaxID=692036 RepID=A0A6C2YKJ7_9BACT|nr:polyribonucleotide nucleotidyltransferase [Tuwongella immobilis]VIP01956.1 polynucleotide phosphorylase : Polyribonucleotide nucleotidyltransferase OS=uncultured planctomycete GN=pnp PE=3 SV=1: RNase_PH: RNase_PH_C: PNPase: RNase_PH: RNase_PH_C: KH_1: S1 [Tuwongella immobilis]VTR99955.1 polynucleotide phosphorylase : Polyribonucleotide nucleotidyltransferase OS=uncultured planctomycete GN=pnp PE=3 SV=1: RNase_PH: RNase_PH_C: PNPase: RNase_PH: RNase_PH_C: KH_1: S1 [Tuwongella immobilis]
MPVTRVECQLGEHTLSLETGKLAKQANGAVLVRSGDTVTLVTVVQGAADANRGFFPLVVDYREKTYAAGKFPGGYIKRESRPSTKEILTSRLIDRPIRPLFPLNYFNEVQIMASVLAADRDHDPDVLSMIGSSAALHISPIPFLKPTGSIRVGRVDGQFVLLPTAEQMEQSDLDLIVSGTRDAVTMIEGFARELPEDVMADAIAFAHENILKVIDLIEQFREAAGLPVKELPPAPEPNPLLAELLAKYRDEFKARKLTPGKLERAAKISELKSQVMQEYLPAGAEPRYPESVVKQAFEQFEERIFREIVLSGGRIDGRQPKEIRPISCEVGVLPRVHGSALFTRGETQALVISTLGTIADEQRVEGLFEEISKKFMLDYNFPPFSVGECRPIRGPGRREIGHGALAERSLNAVTPAPNKFPYTIRLVSEILESNGSSSMATVCGGTLALMDAGVPIKDPVAGISVGLVKEGEQFTLLTDIQGDEDHYGDMDFKVAGTQRGITGIQLDLKIDGINNTIIRATLDQAREARREILRTMLMSLRQPRQNISEFAPRLLQVKINPEKIGLLIGPGGKNIKGIQEATGAKIDIDDDGTVSIAHSDAAGAEEAKRRVEAITEEVKVGKTYEGRVTSIKEFGAFVEILPGRDGLCHISELDDKFVGRVEDIVKVGDKMTVKVIAIDDQDRVKLSRKALMKDANGESGSSAPPSGGRPPREDRGDRGDRGERNDRGDRGDRGRDRGDRGPRR